MCVYFLFHAINDMETLFLTWKGAILECLFGMATKLYVEEWTDADFEAVAGQTCKVVDEYVE